jgi:hypothetical protein
MELPMFTRSDLTTLMEASPPVGVSIFMPTHVRGSEIRQDPIRLKNLLTDARGKLQSAGLDRAAADAVLAPAAALVDDYPFWQHQDEGLALFLDEAGMRRHKLPVSLAEQVVVGPGFHVKPLLPVLARDGAFLLLTITADNVRLYDASRFALAENEAAELPRDLGEVTGEGDYENPQQASPANRPNVGAMNVTNAQVYGDSPEDWRKNRLIELIRRLGLALNGYLAANPVPVVLVADAEVQGHFRKLGPALAGVVETNPEALDRKALHEAAYAVMRPKFDEDRRQAVERFTALHGAGDARALTGPRPVLSAAETGRVDTLLLAEGADLQGGPDEDLVDSAAVRTLQQGGAVFILPPEQMPGGEAMAAVLRY